MIAFYAFKTMALIGYLLIAIILFLLQYSSTNKVKLRNNYTVKLIFPCVFHVENTEMVRPVSI